MTALSKSLPSLSVEIQRSFSDECMYVCISVTGLLLKYTIKLVYVPHCHVCALCYNDDDNLSGPVTKTVNLPYVGQQETCALGAE